MIYTQLSWKFSEVQFQEYNSHFKSCRLGAATALFFGYLVHFGLMAMIVFFKKGDQVQFQKLQKQMFIFGISAILSSSILGGTDFNGVFAWFTLIILIAQHLSAYTAGGKSDLLRIFYYIMQIIWLFGIVINSYSISNVYLPL